MAESTNFTSALASWTQKGYSGRFKFADALLSPALTESFEECIFSWLRAHHDRQSRVKASAEIAAGLSWWADGASFAGGYLDSRASFKALEFLLAVSDRLPCLLDNADPLLAALKSPRFDALPDDGGAVPLKPGLLSLAISAMGSWCLAGDLDFASTDPDQRYATGELVLYVTSFPGLSRQDAIVCFAVVLLTAPSLLRKVLPRLAPPVLPTHEQLKLDAERYAGVKAVLSEAAAAARWEVADAFSVAGMKSYLDLVDIEPADELIPPQPMDLEINRQARALVLAKLRPPPRRIGQEVIQAA